MSRKSNNSMYDVIGIGIGPFNLGLAALAEESTEIKTLFFEQKAYFEWHGGLLIEETTLQVPFLADAVTMANPKSRFSFLNYLHEHERLYKFYFLERFHIPRREYNHYCQWVSEQLTNCCFGQKVTAVEWKTDFAEVSWFEGEINSENGYFKVETMDMESGNVNYYYSRHLVIGIGSVPYVPDSMIGHSSEQLFHSAQFLPNREQLRKAKSITVVGSGQSAAEVFLELLKEQTRYSYHLDWYTRSKGFFPMEYSKLGLEHFSPDYTNYFYRLSQEKKDEQLPKQDLLYKGISAKTIADIYDALYESTVSGEKPPVRLLPKTEVMEVKEIETGTKRKLQLLCNQWEQEKTFIHESEMIVAATGYQHLIPPFISNLNSLIQWDEKGRYLVEENYQLKLTKEIANQIFIQNGEMHTHGVGAPDLGLGAYRNSMIINQLVGRELYPVRQRNVFQQFGV
ncbi:lysine N(6)-hydroxylase/L-ornithine N(5)-oxygenase family protein [Alkalihalobacillus sp. BA299]|uniref:lysine N(6)-hydroxylase/L-ornithine N(5)-oxygenase family protein n=1 Tax=Alkalihalobacillus sp. BA299 TaxID=2815938 RepID=UPI001ADB55B8|nr:lysine N(6)-hydroxylase/L-ornithine N(5)-oxygenase family protein [Alkalihalobacillus sp. BA299]